MNRLPAWFKQEIPDQEMFSRLGMLSASLIHTVCREAKCPNLSSCFKNSKLTFLILGDICTRDCKFCNLKKQNNQKLKLDLDEPRRIANTVRKLNLNYVVITSVTRDDLEDGGASIFSETIKLIHGLNKDIKVEVLIPDFQGKVLSLKTLLDAQPDLLGHNLETVKRLYKDLRRKSDYQISLEVLKKIKEINPFSLTKSALMLGLGESEEEVVESMKDLRYTQCDILCLGQYLAPSRQHYPLKKFIAPESFNKYHKLGLDLGFKAVLSGPLVRSSYQARELYQEVTHV